MAATNGSPFRSFVLGGFECSSHRRADGHRLDLLSLTGHDRLAGADYAALARHRIRTVRDGVRWHLIEPQPGRYDWSSFLPMLHAARAQGTQVVWDLCHYGWPDDIDIWSSAFVDRFARFAGALARIVASETDDPPFYCPVNEISFWAWAGGEVGRFNPGAHRQGAELKRQLVRTAIAAVDAIREVDPRARFITAEPLINVEAGLGDEAHRRAAETYRLSQFEATDMLFGSLAPELGGSPDHLDILGVNFYPDNQWYHGGPTIPLGHHAYRALRDMLAEAHRRYRRPILIAETGAEGSGRSAWLHYVCEQVRQAQEEGVPVEGICLYPILDYPGWDNGRICEVGLLSHGADGQSRLVCGPLAAELRRQVTLFDEGDRQAVPEWAAPAAMRAVG